MTNRDCLRRRWREQGRRYRKSAERRANLTCRACGCTFTPRIAPGSIPVYCSAACRLAWRPNLPSQQYDPERTRARLKKWWANLTPEQRDILRARRRERAKKWQAANPDRYREIRRAYVRARVKRIALDRKLNPEKHWQFLMKKKQRDRRRYLELKSARDFIRNIEQ